MDCKGCKFLYVDARFSVDYNFRPLKQYLGAVKCCLNMNQKINESRYSYISDKNDDHENYKDERCSKYSPGEEVVVMNYHAKLVSPSKEKVDSETLELILEHGGFNYRYTGDLSGEQLNYRDDWEDEDDYYEDED